MDIDTIKRNKPILTDYEYLKKIKKPEINIETEKTLFNKVIDKFKSNTYNFIENNIYIILALIILIILLIYRYFQYQNYKKNLSDINLESFNQKKRKYKKITFNTKPSYTETETQVDIDIDKQHEEVVPDLLNITNDRNLNFNNQDLTLINSSAYAPYNFYNVNDLHPWMNI